MIFELSSLASDKSKITMADPLPDRAQVRGRN
jgi:hypothetical protein